MVASEIDNIYLASEIIRLCSNKKNVHYGVKSVYTLITADKDFPLIPLSLSMEMDLRYKTINLTNVLSGKSYLRMYLGLLFNGRIFLNTNYKEYKLMCETVDKFLSVVIKSLDGDVFAQKWLSSERTWV